MYLRTANMLNRDETKLRFACSGELQVQSLQGKRSHNNQGTFQKMTSEYNRALYFSLAMSHGNCASHLLPDSVCVKLFSLYQYVQSTGTTYVKCGGFFTRIKNIGYK